MSMRRFLSVLPFVLLLWGGYFAASVPGEERICREDGAHLLVGGSLLRQLLQCLTGGFGRLKESLKSPVDPRQTQMS